MTSLRSVLTADEVAEEFLVSAETVYRWARDGDLKALDLPGRIVRFRREDIEAIIRGEKAAATSGG